MLPAWLTLRLGLYAVACAALIGVGLWYGSTRYDAGAASVQRDWDAAKTARLEAVEKAAAAARDREARDRRIAQEEQRALQARLTAADAGARDLAGRLRHYQARPSGCAVSGSPDPSAGTDSAGGEQGNRGEVDAATAEHFAACARDAERLDRWNAWWAGVSLDKP
mgnify:FL=1